MIINLAEDLKLLRAMAEAPSNYTGEFLVDAQATLIRTKTYLLSRVTTDEDRFYAIRVLGIIDGVAHLHPDGELPTIKWCLDFVSDFCDAAKVDSIKDEFPKVIASTPNFAGTQNHFTCWDVWTGEAHDVSYSVRLKLQNRRRR